MTEDFTIRTALPNDIPFIYDTLLRSYKISSNIGKACRNGIFFTNYRIVLDNILHESDTLIACLKNEPNVIFGYIISDKSTLHYCFVKEAFRQLGIAKALYLEAIKQADPNLGFLYTTHKTTYSDQIKSLKVPFNPFLLYAAINQGETHG